MLETEQDIDEDVCAMTAEQLREKVMVQRQYIDLLKKCGQQQEKALSEGVVRSSRGHLLALTSFPTVPMLTVEFYEKWYGLYIVRPDGSVEEIPFPDDETCPPDSVPFVDHVPNPKVVQAYAEAHGYEVDELGLELMIGRWVLEVRGGAAP